MPLPTTTSLLRFPRDHLPPPSAVMRTPPSSITPPLSLSCVSSQIATIPISHCVLSLPLLLRSHPLPPCRLRPAATPAPTNPVAVHDHSGARKPLHRQLPPPDLLHLVPLLNPKPHATLQPPSPPMLASFRSVVPTSIFELPRSTPTRLPSDLRQNPPISRSESSLPQHRQPLTTPQIQPESARWEGVRFEKKGVAREEGGGREVVVGRGMGESRRG